MTYEDKHLVIIGGVAAGMKAAAKARRESPTMKITVVTDEEYISYAGCGMPYFIGDVIKDSKNSLSGNLLILKICIISMFLPGTKPLP